MPVEGFDFFKLEICVSDVNIRTESANLVVVLSIMTKKVALVGISTSDVYS